jgi:antitoxin YefM
MEGEGGRTAGRPLSSQSAKRYPGDMSAMAKIPLNLNEDSQPVSELEAKAAELLRRVQETRRPVVLTEDGKGAAVLVDLESYQDLLEEIEILRDVHRGLADAEAGRVTPHDEARARLLARYS